MRTLQTILLALGLTMVGGVASSSAVAQTSQNQTGSEGPEVGDALSTTVMDLLKKPGKQPGEENKPVCYNHKTTNKIVKVTCPQIIILVD
jgi:hypothetical protein